MGKHTEALEAKIAEASNEVKRLGGEIATTQTDLGKLLASDGNDKEGDKLQVKREELVRAKERANIKCQALQREMPAAERLDAQARLNEILGEATALAKANDKARADYLAALKVLIDTVEPAFSPTVKMVNLKAEAAYWAGAYDLPSLTLPAIEPPDPNPMKRAWMTAVGWFEQQFNFSNDWRARLNTLLSERKRERYAAENRRRQEGISL